MKSVDFLYAALAAFALIHGAYIVILYTRYRKLSQELKELKK